MRKDWQTLNTDSDCRISCDYCGKEFIIFDDSFKHHAFSRLLYRDVFELSRIKVFYKRCRILSKTTWYYSVFYILCIFSVLKKTKWDVKYMSKLSSFIIILFGRQGHVKVKGRDILCWIHMASPEHQNAFFSPGR